MPNDGTGTTWDETDPSDTALLKDGAKQIRDHRIGDRLRIQKEHVALSATAGGGSVSPYGGEHLAGSAKAYAGHSTPTLRPDGLTALDGTTDKGRIWIDETTNSVYGWNGATWIQLNGGVTAKSAVIQDLKTAGTNGGTATQFATAGWQVRTLTNVDFDPDSIVTSLISNQFVLPAGTYEFIIHAPAFTVNQHQARLRNVTDAACYYGTMEYSGSSGSYAQTSSIIHCVLTIAGAKTFQVEHATTSTNAVGGAGFGYANAVAFTNGGIGGSYTEIFTTVKITKLH